MISPEELYQYIHSKLADHKEPTYITSPGPIKLRIYPHDLKAARLLLWLYHQMGPEHSPTDLLAILDAARWWFVFWSSVTGITPEPGEEQGP